MKNAVGTPVALKERNQALDITRGFAVFGILLVNIYFAAAPMSSVSFLFLQPDVSQADMEAWTFMQVSLIGVSRGLFSLMFGAGMMLLLDRLKDRFKGKKLRNFFFKRMGILYLLGLVHIFGFLWFGDILNVYAMAGMILYYFRNASTKKLILFATLFGLMASAVGPLMISGYAGYQEAMALQEAGEPLEERHLGAIKMMGPMLDQNTVMEESAAFTESVTGSFSSTYDAILSISLQFLVMNFFMVIWDSLFMMVIGVWMYRKGWLTGQASTATYIKMTVLGLGLGLGIRSYWFYEFWQLGFSMDYALLNMMWTQPTRLLIAVGAIGAIQLFCRSAMGGVLKKGFAAVGQMALTNYMSHSVIFIFIFYGVGLGLYNSLSGWALLWIGVLIFAVQMVLSPLWLAHYRFGPVEWVWRSLTYGARQPLRR